jgi:CBS domain-containing protein
MTVRAILGAKGHHIISVSPDAKLFDAVKLLAERRIGAVLVMTGEHLDGILSERDIVRVISAQGAVALDQPVHAVMTRKVISCTPADTVGGLMEVMTNGKFRHLPVLDHDRIVGLISIGDVVKWRVMEYEAEQAALRDYIASA